MHGAPVGANIYGAKELRQRWDIKFKPVLGFIAGVEIQYAIKPKTNLHIEVNFERKGYSTDIYIQGQSFGTDAFTIIKYYHDYITIPITTKFIFLNNEARFFINAGIYGGYFINNGWNLLATENNNGDKGNESPAKFKNLNLIDIGLITGLGFDMPINERFQYSIEVRNNLGFAGIYNDEIFSSRNIKHETLALLFGLGYKI